MSTHFEISDVFEPRIQRNENTQRITHQQPVVTA